MEKNVWQWKMQFSMIIDKMNPSQLARAKELYAAKQNSVAEIMALTGFKSRNTFYKYVVNGVS